MKLLNWCTMLIFLMGGRGSKFHKFLAKERFIRERYIPSGKLLKYYTLRNAIACTSRTFDTPLVGPEF